MTSVSDFAPGITGNPRYDKLLAMIGARGHMRIDELASLLGVSPQTIRRDIRKLSGEGFLSRYHGGAAQPSSVINVALEQREVTHVAAKRAIAEAIAARIADRSTVFLASGTTVEYVARALDARNDLRIITTSLRVAGLLYARRDFDVMVPGGRLRPQNAGIVGPLAEEFLRGFRADTLVMSAGAVDPDGTLLEYDINEVAVMRIMMANAKQVFLAVDHTKFHASVSVKLAGTGEIDALFTDEPPPAPLAALLAQQQVEVLVVPSDVRGGKPDSHPAPTSGRSVDVGFGHRPCGARLEEVEVAALVGLRHVLLVEHRPAALVAARRRCPGGAAPRELVVVDVQVDAPRRHVERDPVAGRHQRERPADRALGRDVQHARAVVRAAHARVGDAHHVAHPLREELLRDLQIAPFGKARRADRPRVLQHQHRVLRHRQVGVVDPGREVGVVLEHQRGAGVHQELGRGRRGLHHAAARREVAGEHRERAARRGVAGDGPIERADDVVVPDLASATFSPSVRPLTVIAAA